MGAAPDRPVATWPRIPQALRAGLQFIAKKVYYSMKWTVAFLDRGVQAELYAMPADIIASFIRIMDMIESYGLERMREPYVKHLEGAVWEMRMKGKEGLSEFLCARRL